MIRDGQTVTLALHKALAGKVTYGVNNYAPRRLFRLLDRLVAGGWNLSSSGSEGGRIVLSFDDGYAHLVDFLPELISGYGGSPILFVPTAWIGRTNSWDYSHRLCPAQHLDLIQIKELASQGIEIGSHGRGHVDLTGLSERDLRYELESSRGDLEDILGRAVTSISYPFGRFNDTVTETAAAAGYREGYSMRFPTSYDGPLSRGRYPVYGFDTPWSVCQKLSQGSTYYLSRALSAVIGNLSRGTGLLNRMRGHRHGY